MKNDSDISDEGHTTDLEIAARAEIARLLELRPEYRAFQEEIDARLDAAGRTENRLAVLGIMLEAKLSELKQQMMLLNRMMDEKQPHRN